MDELIGKRIKLLRKDKNLTQKKLSELVGLSEISIRKYENGERTPKFDALEKISEALNVQIDYLLGRTVIKKFDNQIIYDDFLHLMEKTEDSDKEFAKLVRNIVDTMFLTIYHFTNDKNIKALTIIHELYKEINNIKLINKNAEACSLLGIEFDNTNDKFVECKKEVNLLLDEFYKIVEDKEKK